MTSSLPHPTAGSPVSDADEGGKKRRFRILRIVSRLNIGGIATYTILLTQGMQDSRFEVRLVAGREDPAEGNMLDYAARHNVEIVTIPELGRNPHPLRDWKAFWKIYRLIREWKPTIVDTHAAKAGSLGRIAGRLARVPILIHTFHGHVLRGYFGRVKSWLFGSVERWLARGTDLVIMVSRQGREELISWNIVPPEKIVYVPLGLELDDYLTDQYAGRPLKAELGLSPDTPLVGIVARLAPIKNHAAFLRAAALLARSHPQVRFAIVGDGELRESLEAQVTELGLRESTFFTGFRRDLPRVYASLDVVALTSLNEGLPVTLIEAMAAARPVVATDVGGVAEVVEDRVTGFLASPENAEQLAGRIGELIDNPDLCKRMGESGRKRALDRFSKNRLVREMLHLYDSLLHEKGMLEPTNTSE